MSGHKPWPPDPAAPVYFDGNPTVTQNPVTTSAIRSGTVTTATISSGGLTAPATDPLLKPARPAGHKISLLVPFNPSDPQRVRVWNWLRKYWHFNLPGCEIVMGRDKASEGEKKPFSKTTAVNDAFRKSTGDIIVIMDADTYIEETVVEHCAARIRLARKAGVRVWFVPYRQIYRLTRDCTTDVLDSDPKHPLRFSSPPPAECIEDGAGSALGHKYGALIQIMPREAFEMVGGMDCRFRGWGGDDVSFMKAVDTLWAVHTNTPNDVLHLWHPKLEVGEWRDPLGRWWEVRVWTGQTQSRVNDELTIQYLKAYGNRRWMREIVRAGCKACRRQKSWFWRLFHRGCY